MIPKIGKLSIDGEGKTPPQLEKKVCSKCGHEAERLVLKGGLVAESGDGHTGDG